MVLRTSVRLAGARVGPQGDVIAALLNDVAGLKSKLVNGMQPIISNHTCPYRICWRARIPSHTSRTLLNHVALMQAASLAELGVTDGGIEFF